jgi:hypothetical protein
MYKHAKHYKPQRIYNIGDPPFDIEDLKLYIKNRFKDKYKEREINHALDQITKKQLRRFKRYGSARLPVSIKSLLSRN